MKDPIKWQKHLEACRKYRENNRVKYNATSLASARRKRALDPEKYDEIMRERQKSYRLKSLEKYRIREKEKSRLRRLNEKAKEQAYSKQYNRKYRLTVIYKLSAEEYDEMMLKQVGSCAICKNDFGGVRPHIDHCHKTGKVRGLLCGSCNMALGYIEKGQIRKTKAPRELFTEYLKYNEALRD
jgi:hypothetical protein